MSNRCDQCRYAELHDYGYSNWTVEGTTFKCLLNLNPNGDFDRFYGADERLAYAEQCEKYRYGEPVHLSVDGDEF